MKKILIKIVLAAVIISACLISYLMFSGPRMRIQPNLRTYKFQMLESPQSSLPLTRPFIDINDIRPQAAAKNSLQDIRTGKVFYNYYCGFCHGDKGDGYGPVGYSYVPVPADLRYPRLRLFSDTQIYHKMITGTGHSPMLERIIPEDYGWYIVSYIKTLNDPNAPRVE